MSTAVSAALALHAVLHTIVRPPAPSWAVTALQVTLLVLIGAGAAAVVTARQPMRQVVLLSMYGIVLTVMFLALQAPDVALSELTVGSLALPLVLLLGYTRVRGDRR